LSKTHKSAHKRLLKSYKNEKNDEKPLHFPK